jgi:Spy/CpxP family protein refolding chaperone
MTRYRITRPRLIAAAASACLGATLFPAAGFADQAATPDMPMAAAPHMHMNGDETHIKTLHDRLQITADQEVLWSSVAQIMRSNDDTIDSLSKERHDKAASMTAVEDLKSYGDIAAAHAAGIKNFLPAFESLYQSMSPAQQANADHVFRHTGMKSHKKGV